MKGRGFDPLTKLTINICNKKIKKKNIGYFSFQLIKNNKEFKFDHYLRIQWLKYSHKKVNTFLHNKIN